MAKTGYSITFGLVNIPIQMSPVINNNDTSFNQLHKKCLHRIVYQKYCPHCKKVLSENDIIKGYPYSKEDYLEFSKKELDLLKPENEGNIEILSFIPLKEIRLSYFEKSFYLSTSKKNKAYQLLKKAMEKTKLVALCKTVLHSKFYYGLIRLQEDTLFLTTLYFQEEIMSGEKQEEIPLSKKELDLAIKVVESMKGKFEPNNYQDEYQNRIKNAIEKKLKGIKITRKKSNESKEVTKLMQDLLRSVK